MKPFFLLLLSFLSFSALRAQQADLKVSGSVIDGSQKTVEAATIALIRTQDSSTVKYSVADKSGQFHFDGLKAGSYRVSVSAVGHTKAYSAPFQLDASTPEVVLPQMNLVPENKSMAAVTVTAKKPLIEQKIDRTVLNVEASATNVGNTALEVLEKAPGVTVDKDGNISLKGKDGVLVLVDGRPTQLSAADLANLLRSMNASQLDQVEIMTNPPARYDAAGNAGIINIKTKKNKQLGYNASINVGYTQWKYPKTNESINFNYRKNKVNVFTNLSHNYRKSYNHLNIQRNFHQNSSEVVLSRFEQEARMQNIRNDYNMKLGADFFASQRTTLGVVFTGAASPGTFVNNNQTQIYDGAGNLERNVTALSHSKQRWGNKGVNVNFRRALDTAGSELTADLDAYQYNSKDRNDLSNRYADVYGKELFKADTLYGSLPQIVNIYSGKADYSKPLKKGARFEAGMKISYVKTDNNAIYDTIHNGAVIRDVNRSNYFIYEENINAAYVNLSGPLSKKWNGQLGLRAENTIAKGDQRTTSQHFSRKYTQLFPTAFLQYKPSEKNSFGLNYGRRIRRPNYQSLNPFIQYIDRYTYSEGNPNLKPQFSHNVELSHSYRNKLTTTLNYTRTTDIIQNVIQQNELTNETYVKKANIAKQNQLGMSVNLNTPVTKWLTTNFYFNGYRNKFDGLVNNIPVSISAYSFMINASEQIKLSKTASAEIGGWFRSGGLEGVLRFRPMGALTVGYSQQVMKGKGTVRMNVRDILSSQKFSARTRYGNVDAAFQEQGETRVVSVGFSYRLSKGKATGSKRNSGSANDEQNRVGGN